MRHVQVTCDTIKRSEAVPEQEKLGGDRPGCCSALASSRPPGPPARIRPISRVAVTRAALANPRGPRRPSRRRCGGTAAGQRHRLERPHTGWLEPRCRRTLQAGPRLPAAAMAAGSRIAVRHTPEADTRAGRGGYYTEVQRPDHGGGSDRQARSWRLADCRQHAEALFDFSIQPWAFCDTF